MKRRVEQINGRNPQKFFFKNAIRLAVVLMSIIVGGGVINLFWKGDKYQDLLNEIDKKTKMLRRESSERERIKAAVTKEVEQCLERGEECIDAVQDQIERGNMAAVIFKMLWNGPDEKVECAESTIGCLEAIQTKK